MLCNSTIWPWFTYTDASSSCCQWYVIMNVKFLLCIYVYVQYVLYVHTLYLAALQSVFPQTELGVLISMSKEDKKKQLQELSDIVTGIRLFNWACDKGSEGIEDCKSLHVASKNLNMSTSPHFLHFPLRHVLVKDPTIVV